jgi:imidazole glycerol-phosphate synthase subunit HisF
MFRPRLIPVLLLKDLGLVKTVNFKNPRYIGDPINAVKIFNDLNADELVFLDISATRNNRKISLELINKISEEAFMPFSVGGGISSLDEISKIIQQGAEKVVLNTSLFKKPRLIKEASDYFGSQSIVVSIDVKKSYFGKYQIYSHCGKNKERIDIIDWVKKIIDLGAGEIIVNSINNDGKMSGYDLDLIEIVSRAAKVPVVACGGAGSNRDFNLAFQSGAHAVAAGSIFVYHGERNAVLINYPNSRDSIKSFD